MVSIIKHMKHLSLEFIFVIMVIAVFAIPNLTKAEEFKVNLSELVKETQKTDASDKKITIVWWMPEGFWVASLDGDQSLTELQKEEFLAVLRPFVVLLVVDGDVGTFAGITYKSEEYLRRKLTIVDFEGISYPPIPKNQIQSEAKNFLAMMKPDLENMLGPMGENMHLFLFPAETAMGKTIADPSGEGSFVVKLNEKEFKWRLPIGSLLEPKYCPKDKEEFNGSWKYCPWHGTKLKEK